MIFPRGISRLHGSSTHNGPWTQLQMALGHAPGHLAWKSVTWLYIYIYIYIYILWCYGFVCFLMYYDVMDLYVFFNGFYDNFMIISWWLYVFFMGHVAMIQLFKHQEWCFEFEGSWVYICILWWWLHHILEDEHPLDHPLTSYFGVNKRVSGFWPSPPNGGAPMGRLLLHCLAEVCPQR